MIFLLQSTAATVMLGPFVDSTDGVTPETGLTISQADVRLSKNGAAFAQKDNATAATHGENGWYSCPLSTTDTNTLGAMIIAVNESGALPVWREFVILAANVYNSLIAASDALQVHANEITNGLITAAAIATGAVDADALAADAAAEIADAVWDEATTGHTTAATFGAQAATDIDAILTDTDVIGAAGAGLTAVPWNAAWDTEVQSEAQDALEANNLDHIAGTATGIPAIPAGTYVDQLMDDGTAVYDRTTDSLQAIADSGGGGPTAAQIADAVWDEATTGHTTAATFGAQAATDIDAILTDTDVIGAAGAGLTAVPWNAAWDAETQSECADALAAYDPPTDTEMDTAFAALNDPTAAAIADAVWDEAIAGHAAAGSTGLALSNASAPTAAAVADAVWDEAIAGHAAAGSTGKALSDAGVGAGAGAITWVTTINDANSDPIPSADVWVSSDAAGNNLLASGKTNSSGQVTFYLDAGTVYIWVQRDGYNFTNPTTATIA